MLLELTVSQLDIGHVPPERASELGQLGYIQWLGALPLEAGFEQEARHAYKVASPFAATSPAVAVFCDLLKTSVREPLQPLPLNLKIRQRRGGAQARRLSL